MPYYLVGTSGGEKIGGNAPLPPSTPLSRRFGTLNFIRFVLNLKFKNDCTDLGSRGVQEKQKSYWFSKQKKN